jgi:hypothetical protein
VGLDWSLCAWCGKDFERRDVTSVQPLPDVEPAGRLDTGTDSRSARPRPLARPASRGGPRAAAQDQLP